MIKAVLFDLDDTLCDDASAWSRCAQNAVLSAKDSIPSSLDPYLVADCFLKISDLYWSGESYFSETRPICDVRIAQFSEAIEMAGGNPDAIVAEKIAKQYSVIRSKDIDLFPDAVETLQNLRKNGLKLGMITNGLASTHVDKVAHLGLEPFFDHVLIAGSLGVWKPDPAIFLHAIELCGVLAEEAVMVGDNILTDIGGAQNAGIPAIWYNPHKKTRAEGDSEPLMGEIRALSELLGRVSF
jgi:putative hydrolase of the HAD superfamily